MLKADIVYNSFRTFLAFWTVTRAWWVAHLINIEIVFVFFFRFSSDSWHKTCNLITALAGQWEGLVRSFQGHAGLTGSFRHRFLTEWAQSVVEGQGQESAACILTRSEVMSIDNATSQLTTNHLKKTTGMWQVCGQCGTPNCKPIRVWIAVHNSHSMAQSNWVWFILGKGFATLQPSHSFLLVHPLVANRQTSGSISVQHLSRLFRLRTWWKRICHGFSPRTGSLKTGVLSLLSAPKFAFFDGLKWHQRRW
jgi:hypothetical protein